MGIIQLWEIPTSEQCARRASTKPTGQMGRDLANDLGIWYVFIRYFATQRLTGKRTDYRECTLASVSRVHAYAAIRRLEHQYTDESLVCGDDQHERGLAFIQLHRGKST